MLPSEDWQPYQKTDPGVKITIAHQLLNTPEGGALDAINYCKTDNATRRACQRLPLDDKVHMCFSNQGMNPRACDNIPAFTKEQFQRLIPEQIEVVEDERVTFNHEFYPQHYKLKTEGFSEALHKARLINTICAIARVQLLSEYPDLIESLPPYIDKDLIIRVVQEFRNWLSVAPDSGEWTIFAINITLSNGIDHPFMIKIRYEQMYNGDVRNREFRRVWEVGGGSDAWFDFADDRPETHVISIIEREIADDKFLKDRRLNYGHIELTRYYIDSINVVALSRLLRILFNHGYAYSVEMEFGGKNRVLGKGILAFANTFVNN